MWLSTREFSVCFYPILLIRIIFLTRTLTVSEEYTYTQRCDTLHFRKKKNHWLGP